ncbi:MAG: 2,3-bisphosphoglycerate-independent phosphoglycerate mutase [Christensenellales bacterium]|jgi:2,3-bisphosphoglycerate-independent phosphoglycerate mutase
MKKMKALIIMDGFGLSEEEKGNAIQEEGTPHLKKLMAQYPYTSVQASGLAVGLPCGQMGNSEVGHLNMGAGRIVYQELTRISKAIEQGSFFENEALVWAMDEAKEKGKALHLIGLLSDGGVHSHNTHLYALLRMAKSKGLRRVYVHCLMDGRDVPPHSGKGFITELLDEMKQIGTGEIATVIGRYYAMDRDNRWERVQRAYDAMVLGEGVFQTDAAAGVQESYDHGVTDEFILPMVLEKGGRPTATIRQNDSVIFFNFRPDRAREITSTFIEEELGLMPRKKGYFPVNYVCFTQYDEKFTNMRVAFSPQVLHNTLGEYLSKQGLRQLRIAETEKYAHVTFFFNGGVEEPNEGEDRVLIPSPKVATYDLKPDMSAYEVASEAVARIESGQYDVMVLNFANADMVGHTGVNSAAVAAVKAVDECVYQVTAAILKQGGGVIITADHGNSDKMYDEDGSSFTAHTTNPVPFILADKEYQYAALYEDGSLCDVAPTLLQMLGLPKPQEMTGKSLIRE